MYNRLHDRTCEGKTATQSTMSHVTILRGKSSCIHRSGAVSVMKIAMKISVRIQCSCLSHGFYYLPHGKSYKPLCPRKRNEKILLHVSVFFIGYLATLFKAQTNRLANFSITVSTKNILHSGGEGVFEQLKLIEKKKYERTERKSSWKINILLFSYYTFL